MSAISLLLPNVNGTAVQTDGARSSDTPGIGFGTRGAPAPFESILRQVRQAEREEPASCEDCRDEHRGESVGPKTSAEQNEQATAPSSDSPAVVNDGSDVEHGDQATPPASADGNQAKAAEQADQAAPPTSANGIRAMAAEQGDQAAPLARGVFHANHVMAVEQGERATSAAWTFLHAAAANHATAVEQSEQAAMPVRAVLHAATGNQGPEAGQAGGSDPSAILSRGGELGLHIRQMIGPSGGLALEPSAVVPEEPSDVAPGAKNVVAALSGDDGKLVLLRGSAETLPDLDALSCGRPAQADLRELALAFQANKRLHQTPLGHRNGSDIPTATGHEAGQTATPAAGVATTLGSGETAPVRPIVEQVATRVVTWAEMTKGEGRTVFHLRLDPPRLGSVRVELSATAQIVSVKLIASNQAAGTILQTQLHELRQSLTAADVSFANLDVSYDESGSQGPAWQQELHPYPLSHGEASGVLDEQPVTWQWRSRSDALIDVLG